MFDCVLLLINQLTQFVFDVWHGEWKPSNLLSLYQYQHQYIIMTMIEYSDGQKLSMGD